LHSNQNIDKTATMPSFTNTADDFLYWQLAYTSDFGLGYRKT